MKKYLFASVIIFCAALAYLAAEKSMNTVPVQGCPECFIMHPEVIPLNSGGIRTADVKNISQEKTCGKCHNAQFINGHNSHYNDKVKIGCVECHVDGGVINPAAVKFNSDGTMKKDSVRIRVPSDANCLRCHGIGGVKGESVRIPADYPGNESFSNGQRFFDLTKWTGEILSPENVSDSRMNLVNRYKLQYPWDVHLQREVACVSCHFTRNDPRRNETRTSDQAYLASDPRRSYSMGKYLYIPDHRLVNADCRSCHTPEKKHEFLPYKKRHFSVLSCQSCHVPRLYGPAIREIDETVVAADGSPRYEFRTADGQNSNLNTIYSAGYEPFLLSHQKAVSGDESITGIADGISPVNVTVRWNWFDAEGRIVPADIVKKAYLDGDSYDPAVVEALDSNSDGSIDRSELRLESSSADFIKSRLLALGVKGPVIRGNYEVHRVNHGIMDGKTLQADCYSCHSGSSRFNAEIKLSDYVPAGGIIPDNYTVDGGGLRFFTDSDVKHDNTGLVLARDGRLSGRYVFGYSSVTWLNVTGFMLFLLSVAGAAGHGFLRFIARRNMPEHALKLVKHRVYPLYERIWHWGMALSVVTLMLTGLEIHFSGSFNLFGFDTSVDIHNLFAVIVAVNAGLSLFYHLATGEIRQYFRIRPGFRGEVIVQAAYYLYGIFRGSGHPFEKTPERKMNPLQQLTYVMLLNILFPVQIATGIIMWLVSVWPGFSAAVGGLTVIAPVHNFFAWLFISFLAVHLYLITTGPRVTSSLMAMWTGTEEIDESESADSSREKLEGISFRDIAENIKNLIRKGRREI